MPPWHGSRTCTVHKVTSVRALKPQKTKEKCGYHLHFSYQAVCIRSIPLSFRSKSVTVSDLTSIRLPCPHACQSRDKSTSARAHTHSQVQELYAVDPVAASCRCGTTMCVPRPRGLRGTRPPNGVGRVSLMHKLDGLTLRWTPTHTHENACTTRPGSL